MIRGGEREWPRLLAQPGAVPAGTQASPLATNAVAAQWFRAPRTTSTAYAGVPLPAERSPGCRAAVRVRRLSWVARECHPTGAPGPDPVGSMRRQAYPAGKTQPEPAGTSPGQHSRSVAASVAF